MDPQQVQLTDPQAHVLRTLVEQQKETERDLLTIRQAISEMLDLYIAKHQLPPGPPVINERDGKIFMSTRVVVEEEIPEE